MNVELINGSPNPEQLVATAARNDYREDGIIGHSFEEVMTDVEADPEHVADVVEGHSHLHLSTYISERSEDMTDAERRDLFMEKYVEGVPEFVLLEAKKRTLIDHLIDNGHWGPFEHPQAVVAIEGVTRVVTHQLVRHRQFSYDQQSFRYVGMDGDVNIMETFQMPEFRGEDFEVDREGVHELEDVEGVRNLYWDAYTESVENYQSLREKGVPKEQARKVLPMGIKTNIVMSGNARAWMHILNVRTKANVQGETRRCAEAIFEELKEWAPYLFEKYDQDVLPLRLNP